MRILGIESSCDETAAAVVEDGETRALLRGGFADGDSWQVRRRGPRTGLARAPARHRAGGARSAGARRIERSTISPPSPPRSGRDWSGRCSWASLTPSRCASRAGVPLIAVNHIEGHIHAVIMEAQRDGAPVELPALALVVSGGHTHLFEVREGFAYRLARQDSRRRRRRSVRQGRPSYSASDIPAARWSTVWRRTATRARCDSPSPR